MGTQSGFDFNNSEPDAGVARTSVLDTSTWLMFLLGPKGRVSTASS